jgi:CHAT domain-containing protein
MPTTPDARDLPEAAAEADELTRLLGSPRVLSGGEAHYQAVTVALPRYRIAHFACHGWSNRADPAASQLLLFDHDQQPLTVTALSRLRLAAAELAYLSACSTTQTSAALADEAVHITAAFHLAGYRRVIGTLWPINDTAATIIAKYVYTHLTGGGTHPPRIDDSAYALAEAIRLLRDASPTVPTQWVAHLHLGA